MFLLIYTKNINVHKEATMHAIELKYHSVLSLFLQWDWTFFPCHVFNVTIYYGTIYKRIMFSITSRATQRLVVDSETISNYNDKFSFAKSIKHILMLFYFTWLCTYFLYHQPLAYIYRVYQYFINIHALRYT